MGLIKTNEYLRHTLITTMPKRFDTDIYNVVFIPPKDNTKAIKISIYSYATYYPLYEIYVVQEPVYLLNLLFQDDTLYQISADDNVQMYYEEKEVPKV